MVFGEYDYLVERWKTQSCSCEKESHLPGRGPFEVTPGREEATTWKSHYSAVRDNGSVRDEQPQYRVWKRRGMNPVGGRPRVTILGGKKDRQSCPNAGATGTAGKKEKGYCPKS